MKLCYPTPNPSPQKGGEGRLKPHHRGAREKTPILLNSLEIKTLRSQGVKGEGKLSSSIPQGEVRSVAALEALVRTDLQSGRFEFRDCNPSSLQHYKCFFSILSDFKSARTGCFSMCSMCSVEIFLPFYFFTFSSNGTSAAVFLPCFNRNPKFETHFFLNDTSLLPTLIIFAPEFRPFKIES